MPSVAALRAQIESFLGEHLSSTLLLRERAAPLTVATGVAVLDALTGGLPRGSLSEIVGPASSGRTGVMLATLAEATLRREMCALVDASDSFDPVSATAAGLDLNRLLWVRCSQHSNLYSHKPRAALGRLEQVLKVTDLLLQGGGFGMVVLDFGDIPTESARRVPLTSWFRFRRAVEPTATVLLLIEQEPCAKTCASLVVRLERKAICARDSVAVSPHIGSGGSQIVSHGCPGIPENNIVSHAALLRGMQLRAEVVRSSSTPPSSKATLNGNPGSWTQRKPAQPANATFELQAGW